jgi:hypothetical protein
MRCTSEFDQMNRCLPSDGLGHSSAATTWRYARINLEMKRKAIEACAPTAARHDSPVPLWRRDDDILGQLEAIGRRNSYGASREEKTNKR